MAELQFTQILPAQGVPIIYSETAAVAMYAFALDDDSIICVMDWGPSGTASLRKVQIWVIDASGDYTVYQAPYLNSVYGTYVNSIVPGKDGLITFTCTGNPFTYVLSVQVANLKINNLASPILIQNHLQLTPPCAGNPDMMPPPSPDVGYDAVQSFLALGYYVAYQESDQVYASTYYLDPVSGFPDLINAGYVGNTEFGDPWNQTYDTDTGPDLEQYGTASNGIAPLWAQGFESGEYQFYVGGRGIYAYEGDLTTPSPCSGSASTLQRIANRFQNLWYVPGYNPADSDPGLGDTNIPNLIVFQPASNTTVGVLDTVTGEAVILPYDATLTGGGTFAAWNCVLTKKYLFSFGTINSVKGGVAIAAAPQEFIPPSFNGSQKLIHSVVNNARPISLTGRYAA